MWGFYSQSDSWANTAALRAYVYAFFIQVECQAFLRALRIERVAQKKVTVSPLLEQKKANDIWEFDPTGKSKNSRLVRLSQALKWSDVSRLDWHLVQTD